MFSQVSVCSLGVPPGQRGTPRQDRGYSNPPPDREGGTLPISSCPIPLGQIGRGPQTGPDQTRPGQDQGYPHPQRTGYAAGGVPLDLE